MATPVDAQPPPPSDSVPAPEAPEPGRIVVLLFIEGRGPAPAGVEVVIGEQARAQTTEDGVARLEVVAGVHNATVTFPAGVLSETSPSRVVLLEGIGVAAGETTQALVNVDESGSLLSLELEAPESAQTDGETEPSEEVSEEQVVQYGFITGRVLSDETGQPISDAVVLVPGVQEEVKTGPDGTFRIQVPAGVHPVSAIHTEYSTQTLNDIEVQPEEATRVTLRLTPAATQLDDVVITAPHIEGGVASVMSERRQSSTVQDSLGADDIAKTGDGSASSASKRIVGASVVGGAFLFVRGLGGRYSNVRLNGVPLPSTDPDLPGFQLDLFPTSLLSSLTIAKTFSPDIPGDFAGGSMNVVTRAFPEEFTLKLSVGASYNTETTGRGVQSYPGGSTDFLGVDDGTRALPSGVPEGQRFQEARPSRVDPDPPGLDSDEFEEVTRSFKNAWNLSRQYALPNLSLGLTVGDTFDLKSAGKLGYLFTGGYKYGFSRYIERLTTVALMGTGDEQTFTERQTLEREIGQENALLGGLATVGYAPTEDHKISAVSMITQNGTDQTSFVTGFSEEDGARIRQNQLQFVHRRLLFNQLLGEHKNLGELLTINWQLNMAETRRDQPDTRAILYPQDQNGFFFRSVPGSGERLFTELQQSDLGGGLDLTFQFLEDASAKTGYMGRTSERSFSARRFRNDFRGTAEQRYLPPEELFRPENVPDVWALQEVTRADDGFEAGQDLHAGYAMLDVPLQSWLRGVGGVRAEKFDQRIEARDPRGEEEPDEDDQAERSDFDLLPAASLIVLLGEDMNIRGAYGGTVARPQVRELAPFLNPDFVRRRNTQGNPDLQRTFIHNFDLRWELFPSPTEVFAVSLFYKIFEDPIESVILNQNGDITYENIDGANNYGAEFEARIGLGILSEEIEDMSVLANLALIQSQVSLSAEQQRNATSDERPLAGQSPYVANFGLGYEPEEVPISAFVFYNVFGRRIQDVGQLGLPDIYEEPFHSVDATFTWRTTEHFALSASGNNLLFQPTRVTQGGVNFSRSERGATFGLSAGLSY